jgi:hypothetical protein
MDGDGEPACTHHMVEPYGKATKEQATQEVAMPRGRKHCPCGSGEMIGNHNNTCSKCRDKSQTESYNDRPKRKYKRRTETKPAGSPTGGVGVASIKLTEEQIDRMFVTLPLDRKAHGLAQAMIWERE